MIVSGEIAFVLRNYLFLLSCFLIVGCQEEEDPVLRQTYEKQKIEIDHLTDELKDATEKVNEMRISDPSPNLEELATQKAALEESRAELESELRAAKRDLKKAEDDLNSYKLKYTLQQN